jgi:hypothetical protein
MNEVQHEYHGRSKKPLDTPADLTVIVCCTCLILSCKMQKAECTGASDLAQAIWEI